MGFINPDEIDPDAYEDESELVPAKQVAHQYSNSQAIFTEISSGGRSATTGWCVRIFGWITKRPRPKEHSYGSNCCSCHY
jgi:hypothetical protein